jgi:hypothetical protein
VLACEEETDRGSVASEGERVAYVSPEVFLGGSVALSKLHQARPTFVLFDATQLAPKSAIEDAQRFIESFKGGILIASPDENLIASAKTTRVLEMHASTKSVTSYTGSYAAFLAEQEKNRVRTVEAYEKQQREKRRLEEWLEVKRKEASRDKKAPEKGAVIRAKVKYMQREILDKEIPRPSYLDEDSGEPKV